MRALRSASGADHMFGRMQRDRGLLLTRRCPGSVPMPQRLEVGAGAAAYAVIT